MLSLQQDSKLPGVQSFAMEVLGLPRHHLSQPSLLRDLSKSSLKPLTIPRRESLIENSGYAGMRKKKAPIRVAAKAIAGNSGKWHSRMVSPNVKSVTLVKQGKLGKGYKDRRAKGQEEEQASDILGYSSDSMMTGGEIVLMSLYDRSKKIQAQTRKKGLKLDCRTLSPHSPALQPPRLTATRKHTDSLKTQLSSLAKTWGVHFHWKTLDNDPYEEVNLAGKLAHVGHKITQETLRVLGSR